MTTEYSVLLSFDELSDGLLMLKPHGQSLCSQPGIVGGDHY